MPANNEVRVIDSGPSCPELPIVLGKGVARAVVWPGVGAHERSMNRITLQAADSTVVLRHPMEAVYYVISGGGGVADPAVAGSQPLVEGSMVHVEPATGYVFTSGPQGMDIIGGPCPADAGMYEGIGR